MPAAPAVHAEENGLSTVGKIMKGAIQPAERNQFELFTVMKRTPSVSGNEERTSLRSKASTGRWSSADVTSRCLTHRCRRSGWNRPGYRVTLRAQAKKYCEETTLHGVKYLAREKSGKRWYWGIILIGMFTAASFLIYGVVENYFKSPTLVSIDTTDYPVHRIAFPALTICNLNKINNNSLPPDQRTVFGRVVYADESEWRRRVVDALEVVYTDSCPEGRCPSLLTGRTHDIPTEHVKKIMAMTSPSCDEMIVSCLWRGKKTPCSSLFKTQHTDFGYCCQFNAHYDKAKQDGVLYSGSGNKNGLTVMIDVKRYEYYLSHFLSVGFKVLIHGTHDEPEVRERGMAIPPGQEIFVAVTAEETYTTARAEASFTPQERNCYKEHELTLQHTDTSYYTLANCLLSFEAQALFERCGCVAYYMPGEGEVCHEKDLPCLRTFLHDLSRDFNLSAQFWQHCLPACDETKYSTELSSSQFPSQELIKNEAFSDIFRVIMTRMCLALVATQEQTKACDLILAGKRVEELLSNNSLTEPLYPLAVNYARLNMAKLHVFFKTNSATRYKRDVMYTIDQIIANIGGLLGLFMGFSIVSLFELVYFFLLDVGGGGGRGGGRRVAPAAAPARPSPQQ